MPTEPERLPQQPLSVFLVKDNLDTKQIIPNYKKLTVQSFEVDGIEYVLYSKRPRSKYPDWLDFFPQEKIRKALIGKASSPGAILLVDVDGKKFALTFGSGRFYLDPSAYELRFGLKIVLNSVSKVRSIDKDRIDSISAKTRTQARKEFPVREFEFDLERDLLKTVSGVPTHGLDLGDRLTGIDNISATARIEFRDLPDYLRRLYYRSTLEEYSKNDFSSFVGRMRPVSDPSTLAELNTRLSAILGDATFSNAEVEMMLPTIVDFGEIQGFSYFERYNKPEILPDISLATFLKTAAAEEWIIDHESLTTKRFVYYIENGIYKKAGSVFRCLFAEFENKGKKYILNDGQWYLINTDYVKKVDEFIDWVRETKYEFDFPAYGDVGSDSSYSENDYNEMISSLDSEFICKDGEFLHPEKGQTYEFCDLYTNKYGMHDLIHVKKIHRASESSHLFVQGTVSADCLLEFEEIRKEVSEKLLPELGLEDYQAPIDPQNFRIVFVVIRKKGSTLPFMTRVSLREAFRSLRKWQFTPVLVEAHYDDAWLMKKNGTKLEDKKKKL